jgi:hypothetical protein
MKTLRDMKILLKGTLMNDVNTKFAVKHAPKNIINIDETSDSDDDEDEGNCGDDHDFSKVADGEAPPPKGLRHALAGNLK